MDAFVDLDGAESERSANPEESGEDGEGVNGVADPTERLVPDQWPEAALDRHR